MKQQDASSTRARLLCGRGVCGPLPNAPPRATMDSRHATDERGWTLPDAPTTRTFDPCRRTSSALSRQRHAPPLPQRVGLGAQHRPVALLAPYPLRIPRPGSLPLRRRNVHLQPARLHHSVRAIPSSLPGVASRHPVTQQHRLAWVVVRLVVCVGARNSTGRRNGARDLHRSPAVCRAHTVRVRARRARRRVCPGRPLVTADNHPGVSSRRVPACLLRGRRHWPSQPHFVSRACKEMVSGGCCLLNTAARTPFVSKARRVRRCESVS